MSRDTQGDDILMHRNPETCFSSSATSTSFEVEEERGREEERRGEKKEEEEGQFMDASGHGDLDLSCANECILRRRQKCKQC